MKIETKLNELDKVFFIHDKKVCDSIIRGFKIEVLKGEVEITYLCNKNNDEKLIFIKVNEEDAFPTKDALLKSL